MGLATRNTGRCLSAYCELDHGRVVLYTNRFPHAAGNDLLHSLWSMDAPYLFARPTVCPEPQVFMRTAFPEGDHANVPGNQEAFKMTFVTFRLWACS
jgi:hypothetical protein